MPIQVPRFQLVRFGALSLGLALLAFSAGCRQQPPPTPLPTYPWVDDASAIRAIAERSALVRTVEAECGMTLTRPDGASVTMDGILLTERPDKLRLQALKFGRKLFDLTLNPDGMFVRIDDASNRDKLVPASASAGRFAREWPMFMGGLFESQDLTISASTGDTLTVERKLSDGRRVACEVDKPTLTARVYRMYDPAGVERFSLKIPRYQILNGIVYPEQLVAVSEQGTIDVRVRKAELNVDLVPGAFVPPADAVKSE